MRKNLVLIALASVALLGAAAAQTPPDKTTQAERITAETLSGLTATKAAAVFKELGLEPPKDLLYCLCASAGHTVGVGVTFDPAKGLCVFSGLGSWNAPLPNNSEIWRACIAEKKYPDGRSLSDAYSEAIMRDNVLGGSEKQIGENLRLAIEAYKKACLPVAERRTMSVLDAYDAAVQSKLDAQALGAEVRGPAPGNLRAKPTNKDVVVEALSILRAHRDMPCQAAIETRALLDSHVGAYSPSDFAGDYWEVKNPVGSWDDAALNILQFVHPAFKTASFAKDFFAGAQQAYSRWTEKGFRDARAEGIKNFLIQYRANTTIDANGFQALRQAQLTRMEMNASQIKTAGERIELLRAKLTELTDFGAPDDSKAGEDRRTQRNAVLAEIHAKHEQIAQLTLDSARETVTAHYMTALQAPMVGKTCEQYLAERRNQGACDH
jgi:hypothetical protein